MSAINPRPPFESLPWRHGDPPFSAWGLYGNDDQIGTLNLLTPERTKAAASEIQTGVRISLDPPINVLSHPLGDRKELVQEIVQRGEGRPVHDDVLTFNTQVGAQWDGFRHVTYLKLGKFYNNTPLDKISGDDRDPNALGIHSWVERGSIAGRGVLLDYYRYAQETNKLYDLINNSHAISAEELKACAEYQGTELQHGDLLFVRSGFWVGYNGLSLEEKVAWGKLKPIDCKWVGVEASAYMAKLLWDSGIAACAGDAPGWERVPNWNQPIEAGLEGLALHEVMLGGWAMPIGEMFDLEALSQECQKQQRWSFFVTSAPLHIPGGVASPPNCIAIL